MRWRGVRRRSRRRLNRDGKCLSKIGLDRKIFVNIFLTTHLPRARPVRTHSSQSDVPGQPGPRAIDTPDHVTGAIGCAHLALSAALR
ncbi:hypothetical protein EVAR_47386_1 [Eumeta japonica]|uniref:Uncharacterized protein n=1 Tax=Eumeta variegata TaxID=151549 RepID=A0A4C1WWS7_EUMVA|nr:hypothetical protein EVAR_47386_1 [Eumeta japonica]